ncbi:hypothetical protein [Escherichia coli]|uniref:hypothetical protein n=1 Tax=Escherichia coli TaxID=562 RepID=UPI00203B00B5|nr:hypothetical protein [Escherichia coli]
MLLKEEEIKSHLRLDDGLYSDGDFLKLLAQAVFTFQALIMGYQNGFSFLTFFVLFVFFIFRNDLAR